MYNQEEVDVAHRVLRDNKYTERLECNGFVPDFMLVSRNEST